MKRLIVLLALAAAPFVFAGSAEAKSARCYTTDDGYYNCRFENLDANGSFEISARGYPTFQLWIDSPGVAYVSGQYQSGGRFVSLPGVFYRQSNDTACWYNSDTDVQICAY